MEKEKPNQKLSLDKIRGALAEGRISQKSLAVFLQLTPQTVSNKLGGRTDFSVPEITAISVMTKKDISYFFD